MHCKELGVEFYTFHTKPYDFNCVVILTLYIQGCIKKFRDWTYRLEYIYLI